MAVKKKLKGRKVNKVSDKYVGVLQANKYFIYDINDFDEAKKTVFIDNETQTVHIYKNVLYTLTFRNKTIIYDIENGGETINRSKRKIHYIHSMKSNVWIGLENNVINAYDDKCNILNSIIDFGENYQIKSEIKIIHVDYDFENNEIVIFYKYMEMNEHILCASAKIKYDSSRPDIEIIHWDELYSDMTYSFEKQIFFAIKDDLLLKIQRDKSIEKILHTPLIYLILDGGIFHPNCFVTKPAQIIMWDDKFVVVYDSDLIVIDLCNNEVIFCYNAKKGDLIQSCEILNENHFAFSSGLSAYVVEMCR
ncbi:MAG: hypothetical protein HDR01_06310 [Lachnospiraceae bacterium]|nr:hypothetical protein [Lachnospiraceae bacterium]